MYLQDYSLLTVPEENINTFILLSISLVLGKITVDSFHPKKIPREYKSAPFYHNGHKYLVFF